MNDVERVTLKQLSETLGISYEAVRRSFWRKVKSGSMDGHYEKVGSTIHLDEVGASLIRDGRRPAVVVQDGTSERIAELSQQVESLKAALANTDHDRGEAYKLLALEREKNTALLEKCHELEIKLLAPTAEPVPEPAQPDVQPEEQPQPKRVVWWRRLFGL